jgi:hypothetical protein
MGIAAAQAPELLTEAPRLREALHVGQLHPEFEIVPIGFSGRCVAPHGHPRGARLGMRGHASIIPHSRPCAEGAEKLSTRVLCGETSTSDGCSAKASAERCSRTDTLG